MRPGGAGQAHEAQPPLARAQRGDAVGEGGEQLVPAAEFVDQQAAILAERRDVATRGQSTATAEAIAEIPGAEVLKLAPSMRGDKRVAVRFNLEARKATDAVEHKPYVEKVQASDNLRWTLSGGGMAAADEKPLGKASATGTATATAAAATGTASASPQ